MFKFFKTYFLLFILIVSSFAIGGTLKSLPLVYAGMDTSTSNDVSGHAWSDNIGWISFSCTNDNSCGTSKYGVDMDDNTGALSGYAWSDNIGWVSFSSSDLSGCPTAPCSPSVNLNNGQVSGWARALAGIGRTDGWDGWISLKGSNYGITYQGSSGDFSGYAWGSDVVGWVSFSGPGYGVTRNSPTQTSVSMYCSAGGANASANLNWAATPGSGISYHILRSTSSNGTYSDVGNTTQTSFVDSGLGLNNTYYYKIEARNSSGSVLSVTEVVSGSTSGVCDGYPSTPSNISTAPACGATGSLGAIISWNASSGAVPITYYVYRSETSGGIYEEVGHTTNTSLTDTGLTLENYYYKVEAKNSVGTSAKSSAVAFATGGSCVTPPQNISGYTQCATTTAATTTAYISWDASLGSGPFTYRIEKLSGGTFTEIGQTTSLTYQDENLDLGSVNTYRFRTSNTSKTSAYSPSVVITAQSSCDQNNDLGGDPDINYFRAIPSIGDPGYMCTLSWKLDGYNENTTCRVEGKRQLRTFNPNFWGPLGSQRVYNVLVTSPFTLTCSDNFVTVKKTTTCGINPDFKEVN